MDQGVVIERVAVDGGVTEDPDQVVNGAPAAPVLEDRVDVLRVLDEGVGRPLHQGGIGRPEGLEHVVGPAQEVVAVFGGHAEQVADDDDGKRGGDVPHQVAAPLLADVVDDGVALGPQVVLHGPHPLGGEPSETRRRRRTCSGASKSIIIGQRAVLGPDPPGVGERLGVDGRRLDAGIAGHGPQVVGLVVVDGGVGPHPGVGVVGLALVERAAHEVNTEVIRGLRHRPLLCLPWRVGSCARTLGPPVGSAYDAAWPSSTTDPIPPKGVTPSCRRSRSSRPGSTAPSCSSRSSGRPSAPSRT